MPGSCSAPGCKTGYGSERKKNKAAGIRNPSMFIMPKDEERFQRWCKRIPKKKGTLTHMDRICELHFLPHEIERYYETKISNGDVHRLARARFRLKPDAEPTIFPNLPTYLPSAKSPRKPPTERSISSAKVQDCWDKNIDGSSVSTPGTLDRQKAPTTRNLSSAAQAQDYQTTDMVGSSVSMPCSLGFLISQLSTFKLPSDMWIYNILRSKNVIMFFGLGEDFHVSKTVKITEDLQVEVILKNDVSVPVRINKINTMEDLTKLLTVVDRNLAVCVSTENSMWKKDRCKGYTYFDSSVPASSVRCLTCKYAKRRALRNYERYINELNYS